MKRKLTFRRMTILSLMLLMSGMVCGQTEFAGSSTAAESWGAVFVATNGTTSFQFTVDDVTNKTVRIHRVQAATYTGALEIPSEVKCTWQKSTTAQTTVTYSVTNIEPNAFQYTQITSVTVPNTVTWIGKYAFANCEKLQTVTLLTTGLTIITEGTFNECYALQNITIPNGVETIEGMAFQYCASLQSITIPSSVTRIGNAAFCYCDNLATITFEDGTADLTFGNNAFAYSYALASVDIPCRTTSWDASLFSGCLSLTAINVCPTDPNYRSHEGVIYNVDYTEVIVCPAGKSGYYTLHENTKRIGPNAFNGVIYLNGITIPDGVETIGDRAFNGCTGWGVYGEVCTLPSTVTSIGVSAFQKCNKLQQVVLNDGLKTIGEQAFMECSALSNLTIPNSVELIKANAFAQCAFTTLTFADGNIPLTIEDNAFSGCNGLTSVNVPCRATNFSPAAFANCPNLTQLNTCASTTDEYGVIYNSDYTKLLLCPAGLTGTYQIKSTAKEIGEFAFFGCDKLTSIVIPNSVTTIDKSAFAGCTAITTLDISNVTTIGANAFSNSGLTSITIPNSITRIESGVFSGCTNLASITIPANITEIGVSAFAGCTGLTDVTIPNSVTTLEESSFDGCTSLATVTFAAGSNGISIGDNTFNNCPALTAIYNDNLVPPAITSSNIFGSTVTNNLKLYVPCQVVGAYKRSSWASIVLPDNIQPATNSYAISEVSGHMLVESDDANCTTTLADVVTIQPDGSLVFDDIVYSTDVTKIAAAQDKLNGKTIKIQKKLMLDEWNLVPNMFAGVSSYSILNSNYGNNSGLTHDVAVLPFDYSNNGWASSFAYGKDNRPDSRHESFFVWPFKDWVIKKDSQGNIELNDNNNPITIQNTTHNDDYAIVEMTISGNDIFERTSGTTVKGITTQANTTVSAPSNTSVSGIDKKITFIASANGIDRDGSLTVDKNASDGFDIKDVYWMESTGNTDLVDIFFKVEGRRIIHNFIQSLPYECHIYFHAKKQSNVTLTMNNPNENIEVSIIDLATNQVTTLTNSTRINFVANVGNNEGRYKLTFVQKQNAGSTGSSTGRWYVSSNPFFGRLSVNKFLTKDGMNSNANSTANADKIQGAALYTFNSSENRWITMASTDADATILPAEGFMFASANENNTSGITLDYGIKHIYRQSTSKQSDVVKDITFTTKANDTKSDAKVWINEQAHNGFDIHDAYIMISENNEELVEPYFVVDNRHLIFNHFNSFPYEAPINFHASKQSQVEFTMNNKYDDIEVSIVDVNTNEETILTNGESFNFVAEEGENAGRYKIRFTKKSVGIEDVEGSVDVRFTQNEDEIEVFGNNVQSVEIVNTLGQSVKKTNANKVNISDLESGAYIIKIQTANGTAKDKFVK